MHRTNGRNNASSIIAVPLEKKEKRKKRVAQNQVLKKSTPGK